ncbi:MAG: hypothetical protein AAF830_16355, partial [Pseudomonadota bacterium]
MVDRINTQGQSFTQLRDQLLDKFHDHQKKGRNTTDAIRFDKGQLYVKKGVTNGWAGTTKIKVRDKKYKAAVDTLKQAINKEFGSMKINGQPIGDAVFQRLGKMDKIDYHALNEITQELTKVLGQAAQDRTGFGRRRAQQASNLFGRAQDDKFDVANKTLPNWKRIVSMHSQIREMIIKDLRETYPGMFEDDDAALAKADSLMKLAGIHDSEEFTDREYNRLVQVMSTPKNVPADQAIPKSGWLRV